MNSLATDAVAIICVLPLETSWPVARSSTATERVAPMAAASSVACRTRVGSSPNPTFGDAAGALGGVMARNSSSTGCG
ncbi:Uncharacterised protein [Mycobacterium tuberculosis]|nr:Uncharacterised protein [Mycobacterium tuberculosis]SGB80920.1 Uncharacterised protein [Mycobacterium tuberculosis]SGD69028.1 Uncharacterised protein [Mycobacterium tuberculosis]SGE27520.1 Uncharacterised protein [Mycobacterium tuberculosis]SGE69286.1 Uncharacterised protein [Mycobacterium tuberculosis]